MIAAVPPGFQYRPTDSKVVTAFHSAAVLKLGVASAGRVTV